MASRKPGVRYLFENLRDMDGTLSQQEADKEQPFVAEGSTSQVAARHANDTQQARNDIPDTDLTSAPRQDDGWQTHTRYRGGKSEGIGASRGRARDTGENGRASHTATGGSGPVSNETVNEDVAGKMLRNYRYRSKGGRRDDNDIDSSDVFTLTGPAQINQVRVYAQHQRQICERAQSGSWLDYPELPTSAEVMAYADGTPNCGVPIVTYCDQSIIPKSDVTKTAAIPNPDDSGLPTNVINGPWSSREEYLSTHYAFFRAEAVRPLGEAIKVVKQLPSLLEAEIHHLDNGSSIGIYTKVRIKGYTFSRRGVGVRISFSLDAIKKNVIWEQSKRLITGSLVALLPTDVNPDDDCIIATVAARPLDNLTQCHPPEIDLFFADAEQMEVDVNKQWVLVEARSSFFEAQRHTMLALQKMSDEKFPLAEYLVEARSVVEAPNFVLNRPEYDLQSIFPLAFGEQGYQKVNIIKGWPDGPKSRLDHSQQRALQSILSKQLAIVQGPPGTGKTTVSVRALECMLNPANSSHTDPPIIISCQTNHALDQLLRHIAPQCPDFIRLGGRSKDTSGVIESRTLHEVKKSLKSGGASAGIVYKSLAKIEKEITACLEILCDQTALLKYKPYIDRGLLTQTQCESLERGDEDFPRNIKEEPLQEWAEARPNDLATRSGQYPQAENEDIPVEELEELEAEVKPADEEDDVERLRGTQILFAEGYVGAAPEVRSDKEIATQLGKRKDLYDVPSKERGPIFNWLQRQLRQQICEEIRPKIERYNKLVQELRITRFEGDWKILRGQRVIGCTNTGLSKFRMLIASVDPRIIMIEEAAESLEAPIISACMPSVQQLVLVGDHKQLQPQCVLRESEAAGWTVSMFERLVNTGVEHNSLCVQRRMAPEIRRVLYPIYEDLLKDHDTMSDSSIRPGVPGMGGVNCYWFSHEWPETRNENMSAVNEDEADMIVGFVNYLMENGVAPSSITVLTFYNGQRIALIRKVNKHQNLNALRSQFKDYKNITISTVDGYQGEENDVVILSVVRSNERGHIGFLQKDNRVCVALSRARKGFYIFGNAENLACESRTWSTVVTIMSGKGKGLGAYKRPATQPRRIGYHLPIRCRNHGRIEYLNHHRDWTDNSGGCMIKCRAPLSCGHMCPLHCHLSDHELVICIENCGKTLNTCGHACNRICHQDACQCSECPTRYPQSHSNKNLTQPPAHSSS